jgi:alpha-D-ribose 1-methylphosphonate 5-triphosphate synthase subunit PhnH
MNLATSTMSAGFADPGIDGQLAFRAVMDAMARPGTIHQIGRHLAPPPGLMPGAAAAVLALCDFETKLWLSASLRAEAEPYLRFHTDAPLTEKPDQAAFALLDLGADGLRLADFAQGAPEYPDRSTTIMVQTPSMTTGAALLVSGPGIAATAELRIAGLPDDFAAQWAANRAGFPLGVDLLFVSCQELVALPRSARLLGGGL